MSSAPSEKRPRAWAATLALVLVFLAGIAARIVGAWWYRHARNPDYAVVVQMARHIATGREWPVFYYGQAYMGSLEPSVSAVLVALFGSDPFWVCLGTALFGIAVLAAVYRWARDLGGAWAGVLAVALAAVGPVGYFQYMASPRGGYALALLLTVLLLREGSRMAWQARERGMVPIERCLLLGVLGGLGFWNFWLTLPALAAAGMVLVAGLRWRVLRFRVWCPGAFGFALGSLPFWFWNIHNGWASFSSQEGAAGRGQALGAVRLLVTERLPILLDALGVPPWQCAAILGTHAVLLGLALATLWPRRRTRWTLGSWTLVAIVLNVCAFTVAYALSSFSIPRTPRYLLPFVPIFAVLAGTTVARAWNAARAAWEASRWLPRVGRSVAALAETAVLAAVVVGHARTLPRHASSKPWLPSARELSAELAKRGIDAAVGDYLLYGINWAADESLCVSSPWLERYAPYARRLELAASPAVLENFRGFDHFIAATGAMATYERIGRLRVHSDAVAPTNAVRSVPAELIRSMQDERGRPWQKPLTDLVASTLATFSPAASSSTWLEITFAEPLSVCGVRTWIHGGDRFGAWSLEGRSPGSDTFRVLSPPHAATGYYWSGPRFYLNGPNPCAASAAPGCWLTPGDPSGTQGSREEKRFAAEPLEALRVRFHACGNLSVVRLAEFQVLRHSEVAQAVDIAAIADAVRSNRIARVYAGRWLSNQLSREQNAGNDALRRQAAFIALNEAATVPISPDAGIAAEAAEVDSVRRALRMLDIAAEEADVGGVTLFRLPKVGPALAGYRGLRYTDGLLLHDHHRALADLRFNGARSLPPALMEKSLRAALDVDPTHERALLGVAELRARMGRKEEAESIRSAVRQRARAGVPMVAAYLDERLILQGVTSWPATVHAGDEFAFEAEWRLAPGFHCPSNIGLFVHFLRDGTIAFQMDVPLSLHTDGFDALSEVFDSTKHSVMVPSGTASGPYTPVLGLCRYGLLGGRLAVETDLPTLRRRVVVPGAFEVAP